MQNLYQLAHGSESPQLAASPTTLYYTITELPFCSLYFSTFLANLNARDYVRGSTQVMSTLDFAIPSGNLSLMRSGLAAGEHTQIQTPLNCQTNLPMYATEHSHFASVMSDTLYHFIAQGG